MSSTPCQTRCPSAQFSPKHLSGRPSASDAAQVTLPAALLAAVLLSAAGGTSALTPSAPRVRVQRRACDEVHGVYEV